MLAGNIVVQNESVQLMLSRAAFALSSEMMVGFLAGPMVEHLQRRADDRFASQSTDDGPWAPLHDATVKIRHSMGFGPTPINVRTGEMKNWLVGSSGSAVPTPTGAMLSWPSNPTGKMRDRIATAQGLNPNVDAREVIGLGVTDAQFVLASMGAWFTSQVGAPGAGR